MGEGNDALGEIFGWNFGTCPTIYGSGTGPMQRVPGDAKVAKTPDTDSLGYLIDPANWTEEIAEAFAKQEGIALTDEHWVVIRFMREYWEKNDVPPEARHTIKELTKCCGVDRNRMFELFPYGYEQQTCKIAGMRQPRHWTTG